MESGFSRVERAFMGTLLFFCSVGFLCVPCALVVKCFCSPADTPLCHPESVRGTRTEEGPYPLRVQRHEPLQDTQPERTTVTSLLVVKWTQRPILQNRDN